jgi:iron complex transport system substrate-binding protein
MRFLSVRGLGLAALALLLALSLLALACKEASGPVTVTDSDGNQITFQAPPERIVALVPSFVEILYALDAGDAVAAVDENTNYPPEAAEKLQLSGFTPNLEAIAAMGPDLVLIFYDPGDLQASLERLSISVLLLASPDSVAGVLEQIRLLGQVTGRSDQAEELVADMQERIDAVTAELAKIQQGPRVFHEISPDLYSAGPDSFVGDLYQILKAQNIATGFFPQLSQEAIIDADPEVIVLADEGAGESLETVKARPGWGNISAVKNDRVHLVDPDVVSRPGPRLVDALEALAKLLYPELFP